MSSNQIKLDILAIGAHPDDVELSCAGTIMAHLALGMKVGILDLTAGELGTRGDAETRAKEAAAAAKIMGITVRENAGFADGFFQNDREHQLALIKYIRKYQPDILLANAVYDRHPDHGRAANLIADAAFLSGLAKVETEMDGIQQSYFRPKAIYHYIQSLDIAPDLVVDVTPYFEKKLEAIMAYKTQFYQPGADGHQTFISSPEFMEFIKGRMSHFGVPVGVRFGEAYTMNRVIGVKNLKDLL